VAEPPAKKQAVEVVKEEAKAPPPVVEEVKEPLAEPMEVVPVDKPMVDVFGELQTFATKLQVLKQQEQDEEVEQDQGEEEGEAEDIPTKETKVLQEDEIDMTRIMRDRILKRKKEEMEKEKALKSAMEDEGDDDDDDEDIFADLGGANWRS
jgi:hypothetical protein